MHRSSRYPPIHQQRLPGDVTARLRGQENNSAIQIIRLAWPLERNAIAEVLYPFSIFVKNFVLFRSKPARSEAIHGYAVLAPVVRQTHGQLPDSASARAIRSEARVTCNAGHRPDIDDAPVATRNHSTRDRLRDEKTPAQIRIQN